MDQVLEHPYDYYTWLAKIQGSVPKDLWKFFDLDQLDKIDQPVAVTFREIRDGATSLQELSAAEKTIFS